jgi:hypothetical protein
VGSEGQRQAILRSFVFATINCAAAYVVPAIAKKFFNKPPLSDGENLLLGVLTFCALTLLEMLFVLMITEAREEHERHLLLAEGRFDTILLGIRESLRSITSRLGPSSAFSQYFSRELERLENDLRTVGATNALPVTEQHLYLSDSVLAAFDGSKDSTLSIVHRLSHNEQIFSTHELEWVRKVYALVVARKIRRVRRLFVYDDEKELSFPTSIDLFAVHITEKAYDCRVIPLNEFLRLQWDLGITELIVDFGLYSNAYLYKLQRYSSDGSFSGVYSASTSDLTRFREWFEACWNCPRSFQPASEKRLSMNELLTRAGLSSVMEGTSSGT